MGAVTHALTSALNIRPGEGRITVLLLLHSFCVGMGTVSFSTAANALFLATFDVAMLPYVYIGSAGMTVLVGLVYTRLQSRLPFPTLLTATLVFLLVTVCAFRLGLWLSTGRWVAFGLLFWLRMLLVLANVAFWGLVGRVFNVRQGKRLFSLIGSGELSASILGGFATPPFVMMFGTPNLLLVSALGLLLSLLMLRITVRRSTEQLLAPEDARERADTPAARSLGGLLRHPYIRLLILSNVLMVIVYNFVDYSFYDYTKSRFQDDMHLAIFLGPFFAVVHIINVLTKAFLASRLFNRFGLQFGLLLHPVLLIVGSLLIIMAQHVMGAVGLLFWLVAITKLSDEVLWNSMYDPSLLILYQPLRVEQRRAAQVAVQSIFGPLAIGLSGGVLLLLNMRASFTSVHLAYILPFILVGAIIVAKLVQREYPKVLTQALTKRTLGDSDLFLPDSMSLTLLQHNLHSPHAGEILYALDVLERCDHAYLPTALIDLLTHPRVDIRLDILHRIERLKTPGTCTAVAQRIAAEDEPQVRAAALRALCAVGETETIEVVSPYLNDPQPELRMGAMVGLLRYGGIEGVLAAGEHLMTSSRAPEPSRRVFAAQGLGEVGLQNFYQPLLPLLHDEDPWVCRTALDAAGKIRHPKLWPIVLEYITVPRLGNTAICALSAAGESVLPALTTAFAQSAQDRETRIRLARICGRIRGERAVALLQDSIDVPDVKVRISVLIALSMCGYRAPHDALSRIRQQIVQEGAEAAWLLAALTDVHEDEALSLLRGALLYDLEQLRRRLFLLLSFMVDAEAMRQAWETLAHPSAEKRAYALEVVDVLVPQDLKTILLPLLEELPTSERLQRLRDRFPQPPLACLQRVEEIVTRAATCIAPWTRACALYSLAQLSATTSVDTVVSTLSSSEPLVREIAEWTLAQLAQTADHDDVQVRYADAKDLMLQAAPLDASEVVEEGPRSMFTTIEKVIILNTVPIFAETPDEVLAEVVSILDEIAFEAGETIFEKGDVGACMYIIIDGAVRVHDGERTLAQLGARDMFGELAVLDPEPRSASVTAVEYTRLFRLDQESFYDLMADRIEIIRGIMRVLCQQLRSRTTTSQM